MPKAIRKLTRSGSHSYYVLLPPSVVRELGWKERQRLTVEKAGNKLVIRDFKPKKRKR